MTDRPDDLRHEDARYDDPGHVEDQEWLVDVEALVRSAGDYVRPSDDLRPLVLERGRVARRERQAKRWIGHLAACALACGLLVGALRTAPPSAMRETAAAAIGYRLLWAAQPAMGASDASWTMVDSYTELRRKQAELLRPAM